MIDVSMVHVFLYSATLVKKYTKRLNTADRTGDIWAAAWGRIHPPLAMISNRPPDLESELPTHTFSE